jgi:hypothetical protein
MQDTFVTTRSGKLQEDCSGLVASSRQAIRHLLAGMTTQLTTLTLILVLCTDITKVHLQ